MPASYARFHTALTAPYPEAGTRSNISERLAFCATPKPAPNTTIPITMAAGLGTSTRARMPAAETNTAGPSNRAAPCWSPYRPAHQRESVDDAGCASRATAARLPEAWPTAMGRKVTTTPAAMAVVEKTVDGCSRAGVRSPASTPSPRSGSGWRPGRPRTAASPASAATAPATNTTWYPACPTSQTPSGSATTAGTPTTTPEIPSPSPRRSGGTSEATRAPPTTTAIANPTPRTTQTSRIVAMPSEPASTARYPNLATSLSVTSSVATVDAISAPVANPAPTPPAPTDAAYIGTTE